MNIIVMLAGDQKRSLFKGQKYHKLLQSINGKTIIERVVESLKSILIPENNIIFVINQDDCDQYYLDNIIKLICPESNIVLLQGATKGAALTSLMAIEYIDEDIPLVLINGDQIIDIKEQDVVDFFVDHNVDAGTIVFNSVHPRWSYVRTDESGFIYEASEKKPISDLATAGFYFYKKASDYIRCSKRMIYKGAHVGGSYYVCPVFNEMILEQKNIFSFHIDAKQYHSFMSSENIEEFNSLTLKAIGD
jgi:dTDP-glucose pyrophosphorylase